MPKATVKLIVTGDDFGYCPRRNHGIVECFLGGAISNVSLLVNGSAVLDAVQLAKKHCIPIGLHANLSEGTPVCPALKKKSTLLNPEGFFHGKMGIRTCLNKGLLSMVEVKQELIAQVELFRELTGHLPHHMDGHQHVHVLPEIRHIFAEVLEDYGITYTRVPIEPDLPRCGWIESTLMDFYLGVEKDSLNTIEVFQKHGIRWPDIYIGLSTMGKNMSTQSILDAIDNAIAAHLAKDDRTTTPPPSSFLRPAGQGLRTVTLELMTHPGYPSIPPTGGCGEGPDDFSQSWERLHELQTLKNAELQKHYKIRNIRLCAFKDLAV
ncbi:carbohydrate deacetylase [Pantherophis guttatus]|uniref:Carbohydrate deacetylase n=1 Tax=Pantherophis guttatus TaxID=94885 RepID=A0A6P9D7K4_PANGU|nr:carbohydrate deacetylase [Pantherophis guttatus]XP_060539802.1 carbohydrate deacetylase [Pantherophis guttatus]